MNELRNRIQAIDRRGYKAYKEIRGEYDFGSFRLSVDHVQGDPFAAPSRISVNISAAKNPIPPHLLESRSRRIAGEDYIGRSIREAIRENVRGTRGTGKSGQMGISTSGQQILDRNAVFLSPDEGLEARLTIGLPASGRTVLGGEALAMFFEELPQVVEKGVYFSKLDGTMIRRHADTAENWEVLGKRLVDLKAVAFVADGSLLPRRSGIDDRPMVGAGAVAFRAPDSLAVNVNLPHGGSVRGLAVPEGVTLIVGGGFHGKSTLLHGLERGVYPHIPGDGRAQVATLGDAVKIRAEDGRSVNRVNIRAFIDHLPFGRDTGRFSSENASGSTSQAANILEALEAGCRLLLMDEDTSATNFMIRDERMQRLISRDKEPITPFLHRVRELYDVHGVSSVIVMGGSGDYFDVADTVIMMDAYEPRDATVESRRLADPDRLKRLAGKLPPIERPVGRKMELSGLNPARGRREVKIDARGRDTVIYGTFELDLSLVEQLVDSGQTRAIGLLIRFYQENYAGGDGNTIDLLRVAYDQVVAKGLDLLLPYKVGNLALPRFYELAAALNRCRITKKNETIDTKS